MQNRRLNVLVIAEAANPDWTSVPLIGWSMSRALSNRCNVHLVTQVRNRKAIESKGWTHGKEFTAIDNERVAAPLAKLSKLIRGGGSLAWTIETAIGSLVYPYFERLIWKRFRDDLAGGRFDVVHRVTPVSPTAPSFLAKKLNKIAVPYVVGPLNGGVSWPKQFRDLQRKEKEWLTYFRAAYRFLPGYENMRRYSSAIIAGSAATLKQLPAKYKEKYVYLPENGVDTERFSTINASQYRLPLKAAFVGRLVPYKGADMAIEAIERLCLQGAIEYDIFGSGPEEQRLRSLIDEKGLQDSVRLRGFVSNETLQEELVKADLLLFPSVREFGGGVILEAMALGVVPIVLDYAGPGELVTDDVGYKIPMSGREQLVDGLRAQLEQILEDPTCLVDKRASCIKLVSTCYTWARKAEQIEEIYTWLVAGGDKPEFQMG